MPKVLHSSNFLSRVHMFSLITSGGTGILPIFPRNQPFPWIVIFVTLVDRRKLDESPRRCSLSIYFPRLNTPEVEAFQESIFLCIDWTVAIGIEAQRLYEDRSTILYSISRSIAGDYAEGSIEVRVLLRSIYYLANPFTFLYVGSRSKHWLASFSCIPCRLCEQPRRIGW